MQAKNYEKKVTLAKDVWDMLKEHKAWWLVPAIIMLAIIGVLIVFSTSSALSPFIYMLW